MDLYQRHLLTEGIRVIEKTAPSDKFKAAYQNLKFEDAVLKRTDLAELRYQTAPIFNHFKYLINLLNGLMCFVFLILGATSISQLLVNENNSQINFFWALLLFIVPNFLSLLLWFFLYFKSKAVNFTWVASFSLSLISLLDKLQHKITTQHLYYPALFQYYFDHRFGSYLGRSQFSFMSHFWWCSYLLGATFSLLLVLATHQFDFIWQTTILNEDAFLWLTQLLTYLPELLNISVPSVKEVAYASINAVNSVDMAQYNRVNWSNLLIFSLVIYALMPRLILTFIFYRRIKYKQQNFKPDFTLPYYLQLKNIIHPIMNARFIKDADRQISENTNKRIPAADFNHNMSMPLDAFPIAIELTQQAYQDALKIVNAHYSVKLLNIIDRESEEKVLSALASSHLSGLIVFVDIARLPDRGWLTLIKKCSDKISGEMYLVILGQETVDKNPRLFARLQNWIEIAVKANISEKNMTYIIGEQHEDNPKGTHEGTEHE